MAAMMLTDSRCHGQVRTASLSGAVPGAAVSPRALLTVPGVPVLGVGFTG